MARPVVRWWSHFVREVLPCPVCGADKGEPCQSDTGRKVGAPHVARSEPLDAARMVGHLEGGGWPEENATEEALRRFGLWPDEEAEGGD